MSDVQVIIKQLKGLSPKNQQQVAAACSVKSEHDPGYRHHHGGITTQPGYLIFEGKMPRVKILLNNGVLKYVV